MELTPNLNNMQTLELIVGLVSSIVGALLLGNLWWIRRFISQVDGSIQRLTTAIDSAARVSSKLSEQIEILDYRMKTLEKQFKLNGGDKHARN